MVPVCGEKISRSCNPTYIPTPSMVPLDDGAAGSPKNAAASESGPPEVALAAVLDTLEPTGVTPAALATGASPVGGAALRQIAAAGARRTAAAAAA